MCKYSFFSDVDQDFRLDAKGGNAFFAYYINFKGNLNSNLLVFCLKNDEKKQRQDFPASISEENRIQRNIPAGSLLFGLGRKQLNDGKAGWFGRGFYP